MLTAEQCAACRGLYERHQLPIFELLGAQLARYLSPCRDAIIADVGTGPGYLAIELARRTGANVYALDINPAMLALARQEIERAGAESAGRLDIQFVEGDVHSLPWPDGSIDLLVSYTCVHHWIDPVRALQECQRVLRAGGTMVLIDTSVVSPTTLQIFSVMHPDPEHFAIVDKAYGESIPLDTMAEYADRAGLDYQLTAHEFGPEDIIDCMTSNPDFELPELPATPAEPTLWMLVATNHQPTNPPTTTRIAVRDRATS